jgi:hypothetical protein
MKEENELKRKYEELLIKYEEALKQIETLKKHLKNLEASPRKVEITSEEVRKLEKFITLYLGEKPVQVGGASIRWNLSADLIRRLYIEKEGNYREFIKRFSRTRGLTEKKLESSYLKPLIDDGIIELYFSDEGLRWKWVGGKIWKEITKQESEQASK